VAEKNAPTSPTDWPDGQIEALWRVITEREQDADLVGEVIAAAIAHPFTEIQSKGGPIPYALGILKHRRTDQVRSELRRRAVTAEHQAIIASARDVEQSAVRMKGDEADEDHDEGDKENTASPSAALSADAASAECHRVLGDSFNQILAETKAIARRKVLPGPQLRWLQLILEAAPALRQIERLTKECRPEEVERVATTTRETLQDAWDQIDLLKAQNVARKLDSWLQDEEGMKWLRSGLDMIAEATRTKPGELLEQMNAQTTALAEYLVAREEAITVSTNTAALIAIAAGLEEPPVTGTDWSRLIGRLKRALVRARSTRGQRVEKS